MSDYAAQLAALHNAVVGRESDAALEWIANSSNRFDVAARLDVYASGYVQRLAEITLSDYPATAHYMGESRIAAAAREYARNVPSRTWDANAYAKGFAGFLAEHLQEPALLALAKLESAIAHVFWAVDSPALSPDRLAMDEASLARHVFHVRTASALLHLEADAEPYIQAFRAGEATQDIANIPAYMCVVRHENNVRRHVLERAEYQLLFAISRGKSFGAALELVEDQATLQQRLPHYLSRWLGSGFFCEAPPSVLADCEHTPLADGHL